MKILKPNDAAQFIEKGEIIAYPTETVYGIGGNPFCKDIHNKINIIKNRKDSKNYILLIPNTQWVDKLTENLSEKDYILMNTFWPGPLTLIFRKNKNLSALPGETVALRISPHETIKKLFTYLNTPIISTSANISNNKPAKTFEEINLIFSDKISGILEGKPYNKTPSTIFNTLTKTVIREGEITKEKISHYI